MRKWTKVAVGAVLVVLLIGAAMWCCWPSQEPVYKGRRIQEYIDSFQSITLLPPGVRVRQVMNPNGTVGFVVSESEVPFDAETDIAFRIFGTNAVPYIRAALRVRNTWDRRALAWLATNVRWSRIRPRSVDAEHSNALLIYSHILDKDYWRNARGACEPEVRDLMNEPSRTTSLLAGTVFRQINPIEYP